jgi:hypothetical protein
MRSRALWKGHWTPAVFELVRSQHRIGDTRRATLELRKRSLSGGVVWDRRTREPPRPRLNGGLEAPSVNIRMIFGAGPWSEDWSRDRRRIEQMIASDQINRLTTRREIA